LRESLSRHTEEGYVYRVDLRLRPHGRAGELVQSFRGLAAYYTEHAALWEWQALLKARAIAGAVDAGEGFLGQMARVLPSRFAWPEIVASIRDMRNRSVQGAGGVDADVKSGPGGIRDVEFLVQALQLQHLALSSDLFCGNTLAALHRLAGCGVLDKSEAEELAGDYRFLRRVEHFLQILENRQTHALPTDSRQLRSLARRMLGDQADEVRFGQALDEVRCRVRAAYERHVSETRV
jgi:glutamate-ammonia-ligase adenylyltransferase